MPIPRSANLKILLLIIAVIIVMGTLMHTQQIVRQLLEKEREIADLYAKSLQFISSAATDETDYSFVFDEMIRSIDFPMVLSNDRNEPIPPYSSSTRNIELDSTLSTDEQREFLLGIINDLDAENAPLTVVLKFSPSDSIVQYVHYGESALVTQLRWLPYIEIGVATLFIIIGYIGFSSIKRSEQSNIWVGMSKETAHQLGTPLSSIMGWIEIMKERAGDDQKQHATIAEMENDLTRLQKITERFSKIGSKPILREENVEEVIQSVITYFQRRLPTRFAAGKNIHLGIETSTRIAVPLNRELFEWVIENLIKNALDAMEETTGSIIFSIAEKGSHVLVDVRDTGKGIDTKYKKDIFRPGFSTKQRGWGLGLSLSKRIIETYHKGKLFVRESKPGKGTTFRIKLRKA